MTEYPTPRKLPRIVLTRDLSPKALRDALHDHELVRVGWGIYTDPPEGHKWQRDEHMEVAAIAATARQMPKEGVVSITSAARHHGLWVGPWDGRTHVTTPTNPSHQRSDIRRHVARLPDEDIVEIYGTLVTSLMRTILDCARLCRPRWGLAIADSGLRALIRPDRTRQDPAREAMTDIRAELTQKLRRFVWCDGVPLAREIVPHAGLLRRVVRRIRRALGRRGRRAPRPDLSTAGPRLGQDVLPRCGLADVRTKGAAVGDRRGV
ncbi:MAG: hypothetical protein V9G19_06130 [Tetrasphaera sp.]